MNLHNFEINDSSESLQGKTALITGASSGIGWSTALRLAKHGCHLRLVARRADRLEALKNFCQKNYSVQVDFVMGDLNQTETFQKMQDQHFFDSSIVINNAGIALGRDEVSVISAEDLDAMLEINVRSSFQLIRAVIPQFLKNGVGDLISVGSIAGIEPYPGGATYCATKAALRTFHQSLRQEVYGKNIRIMMIEPGMVETEFSLTRWKQDASKAKATYEGMTPLTADDVSRAMVFMLEQPRHVLIDDLVQLATDQGGAALVRRQ